MDDRKARASKQPAPARKKPRRLLLKAFLILTLAISALGFGLPWLLGTPPGRALIVGEVNARLVPGSIALGGLDLSWSGPITLRGVELRDPKGKVVLAAERATLDRSPIGLISSRPDYGTLTLEGVAVDVARKLDGSVDLLDALASILNGGAPTPAPANPAPAPVAPSAMKVAVVIKGGTLKVASPELVEPLLSRSLVGSLTIAPGQPMEIAATLGGEEGRSIEIHSAIDPASADRSATVVARGWPVHVRHSGVEAKGRLDADLGAKLAGSGMTIRGNAALLGFEAAGPALQGDRVAFAKVTASCDVEKSAAGWAVRTLDLVSPVASLKGSGTVPALAGTPASLRGTVDLAALARLMPNAMRLRDGLTLDRGTANIRVDVTADGGLDRLAVSATLDDFAATEAGRAIRLRQPAFLAARGTRSAGRTTVEALEITAAGVDLKGSGDLKDGAKLTGSVDLVALTAQLRDVLDLGKLDLSGKARVAADYKHVGDAFTGRFAVECSALKVVGATATPIDRDLVRLEGWANGPAQADGIPSGWRQGRADLKTGDLTLDVLADSGGAGGEPVATAAFRSKVESPVPGHLDVKAKLHRKGTAFVFDELLAKVTPADAASPGTVALALFGQFDPATGEGTFGPLPGKAVGAIGLGPEGAKLSGVGQHDMATRLDAALLGDLGALDRLLAAWGGSPPKGLSGLWATQLDVVRSANGTIHAEAKAFIPGLTTSGTPRGPVSIELKGAYAADSDRLALDRIDLATRFGRVTASGGMAEVSSLKMVALTGTIEPIWTAIDPIIAASVEPTARVRATPRPFKVSGQLKADSTPQRLAQLTGEAGLDLAEAKAFGVTMGQAAVVLRFGQGLAKFDPIASTLNGGSVSIVADLAMDGEGGAWLRLGSSKIEGAEINKECSDAILSYVAPVLAESSSVAGKITMTLDRAFVPITATGPMSLDGAIAFQGVTFQPGPLASELTSIAGRGASALRLDEAMFVRVADRRVYQKGLSIPIGGDGVKVAIDGSVGFDETLDLKATVPLTAKALGLASGDGPTVALPIKGSLPRPVIDRKALAVALRDAARSMGESRLKSEAGRLLDRIAGPGQSAGEPRTRPAPRNPLGSLEDLGREILNPKKP
jgi:translocation and assembly module TamB